MPVIKCKRINTEKPYIYNMQFIDRTKRRTSITCVEGYTFTVIYFNGSIVEKTGVIQQIVVDDDNFHQSYILLDVNNDAMFGALKIYFDQIVTVKASQVNDAYYIAVMHGFRGTLADWFRKMRGARGYSAYEIAVQNGFVGDEEAWLDSLISNTKLEDLEALVAENYETLSNSISELDESTTNSINELRESLTNLLNERIQAVEQEISSVREAIDIIENSTSGKTIVYEDGIEIPTDGSIFAISATPEQLSQIPITPGCFIIIPETNDVYIDAIGGSRIKLQSEEDVDSKIEDAMTITDF